LPLRIGAASTKLYIERGADWCGQGKNNSFFEGCGTSTCPYGILFPWGLCCACGSVYFCVICSLEGWVIVDAVGRVYVIYLLCQAVDTIVLWDGRGSCLCRHLCCRLIVASGMCRVGQSHIYIRCIYGIFGREITKYTVIYGVYIRFWPTLGMWACCTFVGLTIGWLFCGGE